MTSEEKKEFLLKELITQFITIFYKSKQKTTPFLKEENLEKYSKYILKREYIIEKYGITIERNDIKTLKNGKWLNDKIINFYFEMIVDHINIKNQKESSYTFSTYFFTKLIKGSNVKKWVENIDLSGYEIIFIPVNTGNHWCLFCWNRERRTLECYDSLYTPDERIINVLMTFLDEEFQRNKKIFKMKYQIMDCHKQKNGYDCGVMCCMFGKGYLMGHNKIISGYLCRYIMVHEIFVGKIMYETDFKFE